MFSSWGNSRYLNSKGFSLIEVLIALGLLGIVISLFASLISSSHQQMSSLQTKMEVIQLETTLTKVLQDGTVCSKLLALSTPPKKLNFSNGPPSIQLDEIPLSAEDGATPFIEKNEMIYPGIRVSSIEVTDFENTGSLFQYLANFRITLETSKNPQPKPIAIPVIVYTQDVGGVEEVISCATSQLTRLERVFFYYGSGTNSANKYYCNPDCEWTVPQTAKGPAFITIAGGGASAVGPLISNVGGGGNSGGYLLNAPASLVPGQKLNITVGAGGDISETVDYIIGVPGKESRFGNLYKCSGGGIKTECHVPNGQLTSMYQFSDPGLRNAVTSGIECGKTGSTRSDGPPGGGEFGTNGPGQCGVDYGVGNVGTRIYGNGGLGSGVYPGGTTPLGFGSGGSDAKWGWPFTPSGHQQPLVGGNYPPSTVFGFLKSPSNGRHGIVIVDYMR